MKTVPLILRFWLSAALFCLLALSTASAKTSTWTGLGSTGVGNWGDASNWDNGVPTIEDIAVFDADGKSNMPYIGTTEQGIKQIQFNEAGWVLRSGTGGSIRFRSGDIGFFNNFASGTSTIEVDSFLNNSSGDTFNWSVPTGTTLVIDGISYKKGNNNTLTGGGTIYLDSDNTDGTAPDASGFTGSLLLGANGNFNIEGGTIPSAMTVGGIGRLEAVEYGNGQFAGTLAPGGDGILLPEIGTFTLGSESANRSGIDFLSGSTMAFDIGSGGVGDNDKVEIDFHNVPSLDIESGVTLALFGSTIQDGTYTLIEDIGTSANIEGTFDFITYNGVDVSSDGRFLVNYGVNDISVTLVSIPELSSFVLFLGALSACVLFLRRWR